MTSLYPRGYHCAVSEIRDEGAAVIAERGAGEAYRPPSSGEVVVPPGRPGGHRSAGHGDDVHGPARPLDPDGVPEILARLRRAHGQLGGVIAMIENERSCQDIVTQLSAVAKAVQRAGFAVISQAMEQCLVDPDASDLDIEQMEKLFLRLA